MVYTTNRWLLFVCGVTLTLSQVHAFDVGFLPFTYNKLITAVLLVWGVVFWIASRRPFPKDRKLPWLGVLSVAMGISVMAAYLGGVGRGGALSVSVNGFIALFSVIFFYLILVYAVMDIRILDTLLVGFLLGAGIASISVLMGYGSVGRTGGLSGDPNHYAYHGAIALAVVLLYLSIERRTWARLALVGLGILLLGGIMASLSRGGAIAAVVVIGLWMVRLRSFNMLRVVVPVGILALAVGFFASPKWVERMSTVQAGIGEAADPSSRTRLVIGEYAIRAAVENPILGVGWRRFGLFAMDKSREFRQTGKGAEIAGSEVYLLGVGKSIHNSYLHVAAEMGLLGLVPYLALLGYSWFDYSRAWKAARRYPGDPVLSRLYAYAIFLQIGLAAALVDNMTLDSVRFKGKWLLMGLSTVVLLFTRQRIRELGQGAPADRLPDVPPLPGVGDRGGLGVPSPALQPNFRT